MNTRAVLGLLIAAFLLIAGRPPGGSASSKETGALALHAVLPMTSQHIGDCPPGTPPSVDCHPREGSGIVRGLGRVSESYVFLVDVNSPGCPRDTYRVMSYPARLSVAGKGEIELAVEGRQECLSYSDVIAAAQQFTVTGGSGVYSGASGSGMLHRDAHTTPVGDVVGKDTWEGTLTVPGVTFDVTAPTFSGAVGRTVRAPRGARRVRVKFKVAARDDVDGVVPVSCRPRPGSRFKIGATVVRCSAADTSGNTRTAKFRVTVKPGR